MQTIENAPDTMTDEQLMALLTEHAPEIAVKVRFNPTAARIALQYVASIIPKNTNLPILGMIKCVTNGTTKFTSTDLDVTLTAELPEKSEVQGTCLLPKPALMNAVKIAKREVLIDALGLKADIHADGFLQKALLLSADSFPPVVPFQHEVTLRLSLAALKAGLKRVVEAQSTDENRYVLNGTYMEIHSDTVRLIATDGRRLHLTEIPRLTPDPKLKEPKGFILPVKTVDLLLRLPATKASDTLFAVFGMTNPKADPEAKEKPEPLPYATFMYGSYLLDSRLIEGNFPNYQQVIPRDTLTTCIADPVQFATVLRNVSTVCTEKSNSVKLIITGNKMEVTAHSPDLGQARAELPIKCKDKDQVIAFNPRYLIEACDSLKTGGPIALHLIDELSPIRITQDKTTIVIMPMRLA